MSAETGMRFALWANASKEPLAWESVADRFQVSRATAYRLMQAWQDANGLPPLSAQRTKATGVNRCESKLYQWLSGGKKSWGAEG
jgi:transposase